VQQRFRGFYTATVQDSNASHESHLQKYPSSVLFKKVYQAHYHRIRWTNLLHDSIAITCSFLHAIQQPAKPFHQGNATAIAHTDRVQQNKIIDSEPKMK
jgi:hypothetical protein